MTQPSLSPLYTQTLRALRPGLWVVAGISAILSLLMLTGSIYMLQVYDRVLGSGSVPTLVALFGIVVVLHGFLALYDGLRMRLLARLSMQLDARLALPAFEADLDGDRQGSARPRLGQDVEQWRALISGPAMLALFDLPFTLVFVAVLFLIHPLLGVLTLAGMALAGVLAILNWLVLKEPLHHAQLEESRQRHFIEGVRQGAASIAALGMQGAVAGRWRAMQNARLLHQQQGQDPSEMLSAASRALRMLLQAGLLTAAAWLVLAGQISAGAIIAASILSGRALAPVDQLIGQWRQIVQGRAAKARLATAALGRVQPKTVLPPLSGALDVAGVTRFAQAAPGEAPLKLLDDVSFTLAPGDGLGIIGASASGKSTLARLIVGALRPDGGRIRFDGATAEQWDADLLGRQIGYLPQRVDLLPGSVRDNIARFDPHATDEAVIAAAQAAGVHDMILRLPEGYGTLLGSRDWPLSGGQIQRIGLARALYGDPKLLILDEPNAHLDMAGEAALVRCLKARRAAGTSVIVLAHRAGALAAIDRLIVLQDGRIAQDGPRDGVLQALGARPLTQPQISAAIPSGIQPAAATLGRIEIRKAAGQTMPPAEAPAASDPAPARLPPLRLLNPLVANG